MPPDNEDSCNDIVLVDDDELLLERVQRSLRRTDVSLRCFRDGESALSYLRTHDTRLLLLDQNMPRMTGLEVLKELASNSRHCREQVFLCSAIHLSHPVREAAEELGARELQKDDYRNQEQLLGLLNR